MNPRLQLGPRAQAIVVLALVATMGALAGVLGERVIAQQSSPAAGTVADAPFRVPPGMRRAPAGPAGNGQQQQRGMLRGPGMSGGNAAMRGAAGAETRYAERLSAMLELSADQQLAIDSIVTSQRRRVRELTAQLEPQFREIAQDTRRRVEAVLTPEQRDQMRRRGRL